MKRRVFVAIAGVAVCCTAGQAHAQYPPCQEPILVVEPTVVPAGETFVATVVNCRPNETVVFRLPVQSVATTCNPTTLQATTQSTAPTIAGPATVVVDLEGLSNGDQPATCPAESEFRVLAAQIEVLPPGAATTVPPVTPTTAPGGGSIPTTGSNGIGSTSTIAIVLLLVGAGLVVVARVRRRSAPA